MTSNPATRSQNTPATSQNVIDISEQGGESVDAVASERTTLEENDELMFEFEDDFETGTLKVHPKPAPSPYDELYDFEEVPEGSATAINSNKELPDASLTDPDDSGSYFSLHDLSSTPSHNQESEDSLDNDPNSSPNSCSDGLSPSLLDTFDPAALEAAYRARRPL